MSNEKDPKVNVPRVVAALKNWSPKGLCGGTLVQANGERKKTEACSIGCLALDFSTSRSGRRFFKKHEIDRKSFVKKNLYQHADIGGEFATAVRKYFGLTGTMVQAIMSYNDRCVNTDGSPEGHDERQVPVPVLKTIFSLRKRFEKFDAKRDEEE